MRCILLYRDETGRLPTVKDLLRCGFHVSRAVEGVEEAELELAREAQGLALAAEEPAPYGRGATSAAASGQEKEQE